MKPKERNFMLDILPPSNKQMSTFQSMNLSPDIIKGIKKMNFRHPTTIQRKMIPSILTGRDVFAMSRTGSGKTAGFLIPMLNKLKEHSTVVGIRAMVVSPARELAMQTDSVCRKLCHSINFKIARLIGGDPLHENFSDISRNPDIVIGTPGRILHILKEANISLQSLQCIVFDEADRLFENGFEDQIKDILRRCSSSHEKKQVILVSATLPKVLVGFMNATCRNPLVLRLDEAKISPTLKMAFFFVPSNSKWGILLWLLRSIISRNDSTLIFTPTRHHAELAKMVIEKGLDIECALVYGTMFALSRKQNLSDFRKQRKNILIVTDVAARGIDIPFLSNVVMLNIPAQPKLFLHRVGRAARAGRVGTAYSLVSPGEMGYFSHLKLLIESSEGNKIIKMSPKLEDMVSQFTPDPNDHYIGGISQSVLDFENGRFKSLLKNQNELVTQFSTVLKAQKKFKQTQSAPKSSHVRKGNQIIEKLGIHPLAFMNQLSKLDKDQSKSENLRNLISEAQMKRDLHNVDIQQTVFEFGMNRGTSNEKMMKELRKKRSLVINEAKKKKEGSNDFLFLEKFKSSNSSSQNKKSNNFRTQREIQKNMVTSFRDPNFFVEPENSVDTLQLNAFSVSDQKSGDREFEDSSTQQKSRLVWKKGKYTRVHIQKNERWDSITKKARKSRFETDGKTYEKWRKRTGGRVQKVGEREKESAFGFSRDDDEEEQNYSKLMNSGSGFHHERGVRRREDIEKDVKPPKKLEKFEKFEKFDGGVVSEDKLQTMKEKKRRSQEHKKRSFMVRKNRKVKEKWHFEAMDRKRDEIKRTQEKFQKKRVGKKRMREIQKNKGLKGSITRRPKKRRKLN